MKALESTIDMDPKSRKLAFAQQYKQIIKANPRKIMPNNLFNAFDEARQGLKELKDRLPANNFEVREASRQLDAQNEDGNDGDTDSDDFGDDGGFYDAGDDGAIPVRPMEAPNNNGRAYFEPMAQRPAPRIPAGARARLEFQEPIPVSPTRGTNIVRMPTARSPEVPRRRPTAIQEPIAVSPARGTNIVPMPTTARSPEVPRRRPTAKPTNRQNTREANTLSRSRSRSRAPTSTADRIFPITRRRSGRTRNPVERYDPSTGKGKKMNKIQTIIQKMKNRK